MKTYSAYIQYDAKRKQYVGFVPGIYGAEAAGATREEVEYELERALAASLRAARSRRRRAKERRPARGAHRIDLQA